MKRTPIKPYSKKRARRDASYPAARRAVFDRGEGMCELSIPKVDGGVWRCDAEMMQVHHIRGRKIPDPHALTNLAGLCVEHHRMAHAEPEWARQVGLMKSRLGGQHDNI